MPLAAARALIAGLRQPGSLGARLVLILTGVGLAGSLGITLVLAAIITPSVARLEARSVAQHVVRTKEALAAEAASARRAAENAARGTVVSSTGFYTRQNGTLAVLGVARTARGVVTVVRRIDTERLATALDGKVALTAPDAGRAPDTLALMTIAVPVAGADGRPVASVRLTVERDVSILGRRMLLLAIAGSTLLLLLVLLMLRRVIARLVLRPLARVERHMQRVRASGSLGPLDDDGRQDEIGALGASFNAMLRQLRDLREQIAVQSFALGRSESAVAVMHNVRNALSPVTTILSQSLSQVPPIGRATLDRAAAELARSDASPARRQQLAAFVAAGVEALETARIEQLRQLDIARTAMAHVLEIIGQQQAAAHERPPLAACDVTALVAQNAAIAHYAGGAAIAFSYPAQPCPVLADRVILSQVIGNLFANAAEAIAATGRGGGTIAVTVVAKGDTIAIRIRDDGDGFDPATAATLFQRGFSTRAHKSGGLGLHWCANAMTAMQGSLRLESEGRGKGATAILTLRAVEAAALAA